MEKVLYMSKDNVEKIKDRIKNYHENYYDVISIPENIKFGVEIEFLSPHHLNDIIEEASNTSYEFGYDGITVTSILEAVSPVLTNKKETWQELRRVLNIIKSTDAYVDERVGAHIHFDNSIINDNNVVSFLKLWYVFEEIIYQFSYGEFDHLRYDAFLYANKLDTELRTCLDDYEKGNQDLTIFANFDKGYGINLSNHLSSRPIHYKNTYEIRCPNGTINENTWQNNINFFAHLLLFGANQNNVQIINDYYYKGRLENNDENAIALSELIFENDNDKLDFLKQYMTNSVDNRQKQNIFS